MTRATAAAHRATQIPDDTARSWPQPDLAMSSPGDVVTAIG
jgi:hypothetical protein